VGKFERGLVLTTYPFLPEKLRMSTAILILDSLELG
jgi:hypothetical protein